MQLSSVVNLCEALTPLTLICFGESREIVASTRVEGSILPMKSFHLISLSGHSLNATLHGLETGLHLPHEGWQSSDDRGHGGRARSPPYEAEELARPATTGRSKLRGGALHRLHQELATHR